MFLETSKTWFYKLPAAKLIQFQGNRRLIVEVGYVQLGVGPISQQPNHQLLVMRVPLPFKYVFVGSVCDTLGSLNNQ